MKILVPISVLLFVLTPLPAIGQTAPIFPGPTIKFLPPADSTSGTVAFGSTVTPQGIIGDNIDLYAGGVKRVSGVTSVGITASGSQAIYADVTKDGEGVALLDIASGEIHRVAVDTQGCIRPLALCFTCFFACVTAPHASIDGKKVLYSVARDQPFYLVNSDGTGLTRLPVYSGALAPSPQRVISSDGQVVFTSQAPFGPTFAATATDVYIMNLDGTNIRNLTKFGNDSNIYAANATISQDGATVVFQTNYQNGNSPLEMQIWAVQSDGTKLRQLTFDPGGLVGGSDAPSISGDGKAVVYTQGTVIGLAKPFEDPPPFGRRNVLYPFANSYPQSPVISADGKRVTFLLGSTATAAGAVYQVNIDSTGFHSLHAPRAISPRGVVSAVGSSDPPSPGGLLSVYGINFTDDKIAFAGGFPLPDTLAGVSVLANARKLPLLSVSPWQVNAQLPQDTPLQDVNFQVAAGGTSTPPEVTTVPAAAPGVFSIPLSVKGAVFLQAAVVHAGTAILADDEHPAKAGEALEMFGTGLGVTAPMVPAGLPSPSTPPAQVGVIPQVLLGNVPARVLFAGLTPGLVGVYQINIIVPDGLRAGRYQFTLKSGASTGYSTGTIAVQ